MHFFRLTFYVPVCGSFVSAFLHMDHTDYYYYLIWIRLLGFVFRFMHSFPTRYGGKKMVYKLFPKTSSENNSFFRKSLV